MITGADVLDYEIGIKKGIELIESGKDANFGLLVVCGLNVGLRVSDLRKITYSQLQQKSFVITEQKTKKKRRVVINSVVLEAVGRMPESAQKSLGGKCFISRKGSVFSPQHINRLLEKHFGNKGKKISSHSLRKSWGRRYYDKYKNNGGLEDLQLQFNHSSPTDTLKYIGITQERLDRMYERVV